MLFLVHNRVPRKKMYLVVLWIYERIFDVDVENGIHIS